VGLNLSGLTLARKRGVCRLRSAGLATLQPAFADAPRYARCPAIQIARSVRRGLRLRSPGVPIDDLEQLFCIRAPTEKSASTLASAKDQMDVGCLSRSRRSRNRSRASSTSSAGFFRFVANFEPLRQILDGIRAILHFDARGDAGLTRAWVASGLGLVFWMGLDILVTTWYDRKRLYWMPPELMEYIDGAVLEYRKQTRESTAARLGSAPNGRA
jgi:hypothetical protein